MLAAALLLVAAAAATTTAHAQFRQGLVRMRDPALSRGLALDAKHYRVLNNIPAARNVAAFRYRLPNGEERTLAIDSEPFSPGGGKRLGEGHSEERLDMILEAWGIDPDWVVEIYSELEPCAQRGHFCANLIKNKFQNLEDLHWSLDYPFDETSDETKERTKAIREKSVNTLRDTVRELRKENSLPGGRGTTRAKNPFGPGRGRAAGADPALHAAVPRRIDLTSLQLRYVADAGRGGLGTRSAGCHPRPRAISPRVSRRSAGRPTRCSRGWRFRRRRSGSTSTRTSPTGSWILARPDRGRPDPARGRPEAQEGQGQPDQPEHRVRRSFLGRGRAHLRRAGSAGCISLRAWIVPEPATVRETATRCTSSTRRSRSTASRAAPGPRAATPAARRKQPPPRRKEELWRRDHAELIKGVNTKPEYAALRRVYLARVAAEWFRVRQGERPTSLSKVIAQRQRRSLGDAARLGPVRRLQPVPAFDRTGEWSAERRIVVGGQEYTRTISYGGVDFSSVPRQNVAKRDFNARYPRLARRIRESRAERQADAEGDDEVWLGGGAGPGVKAAALELSVTTPQRRVRAGQQVTYRLRARNLTGGRSAACGSASGCPRSWPTCARARARGSGRAALLGDPSERRSRARRRSR